MDNAPIVRRVTRWVEAEVAIRTEDPYAVIRRTWADRPIYVDVTIGGLLAGATDPDVSKSVKLFRHVQSYGTGGTGMTLDRTQATVLSQASIVTNGLQTLTYTVNSVPVSRILVLNNYDAVFDAEGRWTMEIVMMKVNGSFTSIE